jgi:hypothetical protein
MLTLPYPIRACGAPLPEKVPLGSSNTPLPEIWPLPTSCARRSLVVNDALPEHDELAVPARARAPRAASAKRRHCRAPPYPNPDHTLYLYPCQAARARVRTQGDDAHVRHEGAGADERRVVQPEGAAAVELAGACGARAAGVTRAAHRAGGLARSRRESARVCVRSWAGFQLHRARRRAGAGCPALPHSAPCPGSSSRAARQALICRARLCSTPCMCCAFA